MAVHILGIRHHGPGSARNVKNFLEEIKPDIVLVEGPPEADSILQWVSHVDLKPPVAILCFQPGNPQHSSFYPFAEFSPEWQAILYARKNNIHVRFMDLPLTHSFAISEEDSKTDEVTNNDEAVEAENNIADADRSEPDLSPNLHPLNNLAEAAGYHDHEKWWEHMFEHRRNNEEVFDAVQEVMAAARENFSGNNDKTEQLREAYMRRTIRQAEKEMFQNIAVICGAWHSPALVDLPKEKEDNLILKGLPKVKVECTWIPWTYNRLSYYSGYGAGIHSPGWYEHIWKHPSDDGSLWMAKVASLFRKKEKDTSVAHVIEAIRLAQSLAALRNLNRAGLEELNEATLSVLCNGEPILLSLVNRELIISDKMGEVPVEIPKPPLQLDIEKTQKRLRLPATADWKDYTLDLRKENDLERSVFLHRLKILEIKWGQKQEITGKGTFKEQWRLQWDPAFSIEIIERGAYGNTTEAASKNFLTEQIHKAESLAMVCLLLENCLPAELPELVELLIEKITNLSAASGDVVQLMEVLPSLINITRYGNVRKTDAEMVQGVAESMITRICISLPAACTGIDEEAAMQLFALLSKMDSAVDLLQHQETSSNWQQTLLLLATGKNTTPVIAGYSTRLLADRKLMEGEELVKAFHYAMSTSLAAATAAAWIEGFLKGSGTLLLLDNNLWSVINDWLVHLNEEAFTQVLPLLRRTFSNFSPAERRKLGEKAKTGGSVLATKEMVDFDEAAAMQGIPIVMQLFGYKTE